MPNRHTAAFCNTDYTRPVLVLNTPRPAGSQQAAVSILHHGNPTPAGISGGRPHCVIPVPRGCDWTGVSLASSEIIALGFAIFLQKPDVYRSPFGSRRISLRRLRSHDSEEKVPDECVSSCSMRGVFICPLTIRTREGLILYIFVKLF